MEKTKNLNKRILQFSLPLVVWASSMNRNSPETGLSLRVNGNKVMYKSVNKFDADWDIVEKRGNNIYFYDVEPNIITNPENIKLERYEINGKFYSPQDSSKWKNAEKRMTSLYEHYKIFGNL